MEKPNTMLNSKTFHLYQMNFEPNSFRDTKVEHKTFQSLTHLNHSSK